MFDDNSDGDFKQPPRKAVRKPIQLPRTSHSAPGPTRRLSPRLKSSTEREQPRPLELFFRTPTASTRSIMVDNAPVIVLDSSSPISSPTNLIPPETPTPSLYSASRTTHHRPALVCGMPFPAEDACDPIEDEFPDRYSRQVLLQETPEDDQHPSLLASDGELPSELCAGLVSSPVIEGGPDDLDLSLQPAEKQVDDHAPVENLEFEFDFELNDELFTQIEPRRSPSLSPYQSTRNIAPSGASRSESGPGITSPKENIPCSSPVDEIVNTQFTQDPVTRIKAFKSHDLTLLPAITSSPPLEPNLPGWMQANFYHDLHNDLRSPSSADSECDTHSYEKPKGHKIPPKASPEPTSDGSLSPIEGYFGKPIGETADPHFLPFLQNFQDLGQKKRKRNRKSTPPPPPESQSGRSVLPNGGWACAQELLTHAGGSSKSSLTTSIAAGVENRKVRGELDPFAFQATLAALNAPSPSQAASSSAKGTKANASKSRGHGNKTNKRGKWWYRSKRTGSTRKGGGKRSTRSNVSSKPATGNRVASAAGTAQPGTWTPTCNHYATNGDVTLDGCETLWEAHGSARYG
ncbi:hypothetical protein IWQ62_001525 [Dispira parvispora]|uniref:Uncharacterized protein n=1 Tax=Dispira parvispora TaxID=1520584 RepID=A0A9W8AS63_9FUNG|nr:hypothetical protein IWQ62_001525 [Dispira parvispora]